MNSIGDMARQLILSTHQSNLKQNLDNLAIQVATGLTHDASEHLNGEISVLISINRSLEKIDAYQTNIVEAGLVASTTQSSLEIIQTSSQNVADSLIASEMTPEQSLMNSLSEDAENSLEVVVGELNRSLSGRFLYSGTSTNTAAVYSSEELLADVVTALTGSVNLDDVETGIETFFSYGGLFDTNAYQGSDNFISAIPLSETESVAIEVTAQNDDIKEILKPLVMAAIATDSTLGLDVNVQTDILRKSGENLYGAQSNITALRADLGMVEARIEDASVKNESERSAISLAKLNLIGVDAYEASVNYESASVQLESLFAITARSSRLSLVDYL